MAKEGLASLDTNDVFPKLDFELVSGETLSIPEGLGEDYGILMFYRGSWWPLCIQQLADFQKWSRKFEEEDARIMAGSIDSIEKTKETVEKLGITYPVAYSLSAVEISRITGAYYDRDNQSLCPTGFLLRPDKTIDVACYSSGPVGRFVAKDLLGLIKFYRMQKKEPEPLNL